MKRTVINLLKEASQKYKTQNYISDKIENEYKGKSFQVVDMESNWLASSLCELGIEKFDKLAILSEGRGDWIISEFGIIKSGAQAVPLSVKLTSEEILFRLNHANTKGIFISKNNINKLFTIWNRIENNDFKIFYFDNIDESLKTNLVENGIANIDGFLSFNHLIKEGKKNYLKNMEKLDTIEKLLTEDDVVTICYSSGTTGNPKGIMLTHLNYVANSTDVTNFFQIENGIKLLITLPLDHAFTHTVAIYVSLIKGLSIYFVDATGGPMSALKNMPINMLEVKPNFLLSVPSLSGNFMNKMIEGINQKGGVVNAIFKMGLKSGMIMNGDRLQKANLFSKIFCYLPYLLAEKLIFTKLREIFGGELQYIISGGALLDIRQQKFFYTIGIPIYQGYGLTEASPIISTNTAEKHKMGTSGLILPNIKYKFVDKDGQPAPKGVKGELVIKGENVMKGYYKNSKASEEVLKDDWLYTGDLGYIDKDDYLMIVGREKALLISQDGEKYSPEEIEEAIVNCSPLIAQVMLYNDHNKFTSALVTLNIRACETYIQQHKSTNAETLIESIRKSFLTFKHHKEYKDRFFEKWIPSSFIILENQFTEQNQMVNSTLKMVRYKIKETYKEELEYAYTPEGGQVKNPKNIACIQRLFF